MLPLLLDQPNEIAKIRCSWPQLKSTKFSVGYVRESGNEHSLQVTEWSSLERDSVTRPIPKDKVLNAVQAKVTQP